MTTAASTPTPEGARPPIELRHRLRIAREYAGLDQDQLAVRMNAARSTVSNAETGRVTPRRMVVSAWALACGVSRDWLTEPGKPDDDEDGSSYGLGIKRIQPKVSSSKQCRSGRCKCRSKYVNTARLRMVQ